MPVVGFLSVQSPNDLSDAGLIAPFLQAGGLKPKPSLQVIDDEGPALTPPTQPGGLDPRPVNSRAKTSVEFTV